MRTQVEARWHRERTRARNPCEKRHPPGGREKLVWGQRARRAGSPEGSNHARRPWTEFSALGPLQNADEVEVTPTKRLERPHQGPPWKASLGRVEQTHGLFRCRAGWKGTPSILLRSSLFGWFQQRRLLFLRYTLPPIFRCFKQQREKRLCDHIRTDFDDRFHP